MANYVGLAGFIHVEDHAYISGGVVIHQFVQVGRYCMIGANSKIPQDVLPFFLIDGVPGRIRGINSIGLRKAGFSSQEMLDLKNAYRILFRRPISLREKLDLLSVIESEHVRHLVLFINSTKRGFCRAERSNPVK
jgi:UDP-N-acetylglucosamine acyltransferase